jgi:hypothetical protein
MYISCFSALNNGLLLITIVNIWKEKKRKQVWGFIDMRDSDGVMSSRYVLLESNY